MGAKIRVMQVLAICCVCNMPFHTVGVDGGESPDDSTREAVTMELTGLEVGESSLVLSYTIRNGSDHDVWVCSKVSLTMPFEAFLTHDAQTFLIRKRLDVPSQSRLHASPTLGTYVRLSPGDSLADVVTIDFPAMAQVLYASIAAELVKCTARRLVLEIGYYDEDLPALVRSILEVADGSTRKYRRLIRNCEEPTFEDWMFRTLFGRLIP